MTSSPSPSTSSISFRDLIETVFRRRGIALVTIPLVLAAVAAWTLLSGRLYQSEMKILVQNSRGNLVISAEKSATSINADVTEEQINSELEILNSRDVLDIVVDPAWDQKPVSQRTALEVTAHDLKLTRLENRITTETGRKSNVITVTFLGSSPAESQDTLNRLVTAFLSKERRLERPSGASDFFVQQSDRYRQLWNDATQSLVDFQREHQLVALPDQEASLEKDIDALKTEQRTMEISLSELEGRLHSSATNLSQIPPRQATERKVVPNQQSVQELNSLVVSLENKRTALLTQFPPTDRQVQEIDQQLATTRKALEAASASTSVEETSDVNPVWQALITHSVQDRVSRDALREQHNAVKQQLNRLQAQLAKTQGLTVQFDELKSKADDLKEDYTLYTQKREQAQIEDAMDARQLLNVTIAETPTLSNVQVQPRPLRNLALGLLTGIVLSIALIYLVEMGRTTIVTPRELEAASSFPVLATIPMLSRSRLDSEDGVHHSSLATSAELLDFLLRDLRDDLREGRLV